jgi:hypothetical protein
MNYLRVCRTQNLEGKIKIVSVYPPCVDGFGGLVVCVLASVSRVRGFESGRSRWIFFRVKNPRHAFLRRGKLNNLSHVPTLGHVKDPFSRG